MNPNMQAIIDVATDLESHITELCKSYNRLPQVIEREHDAISHGQFDQVAFTSKEKRQIGVDVEFAMNAIVMVCHRYGNVIVKITQRDERTSATVDQIVKDLKKLTERLSQEGKPNKSLEICIDRLELQFENYRFLARQIRPMIEMNKKVIEKVLENHRKSYAFWLEYSAESLSSYSAAGRKASKNQQNAFVAKA